MMISRRQFKFNRNLIMLSCCCCCCGVSQLNMINHRTYFNNNFRVRRLSNLRCLGHGRLVFIHKIFMIISPNRQEKNLISLFKYEFELTAYNYLLDIAICAMKEIKSIPPYRLASHNAAACIWKTKKKSRHTQAAKYRKIYERAHMLYMHLQLSRHIQRSGLII